MWRWSYFIISFEAAIRQTVAYWSKQALSEGFINNMYMYALHTKQRLQLLAGFDIKYNFQSFRWQVQLKRSVGPRIFYLLLAEITLGCYVHILAPSHIVYKLNRPYQSGFIFVLCAHPGVELISSPPRRAAKRQLFYYYVPSPYRRPTCLHRS